MKTLRLLAFALFLKTLPASAAAFAAGVLAYDAGTGFATEFGSGLGYTNPGVALGPPNPNTAFGAVTPFNPPFSRDEIVSLGTNGSLVVSFGAPILNDPSHPFGLDFIIYGSTGFIDADFPNGHTDGSASVFGNNSGLTRVSVSAGDGIFYTLNPLFAPTVDAFFPTDGAGTFGLPVNPALQPADFADRSLGDIRALYAGSAGGAGYDLSWALDANGQPANLSSISLVRVEVLSGRAEIDGFAAVPEPATWMLGGLSALVVLAWRRGSGTGLTSRLIRSWRRASKHQRARPARQPRRGDLSVERPQPKPPKLRQERHRADAVRTVLTVRRDGDAAPPGLVCLFANGFYKDSAPNGADQTS